MPKPPRNSTVQHGTDRRAYTQITKTVQGVGRRKLGGWWLLAPLLIPAVAAGTAAFADHKSLQESLATSSKTALQRSGFDVSSVQFDGRDATVSLTSGDVERAREIVNAQPGVRVAVVNVVAGAASGQSTAAPSSSPLPTSPTTAGAPEPTAPAPSAPVQPASSWDGVTLKRTAAEVMIQATVSSDSAKEALRRQVEQELSPTPVIDEIVVSPQVPDVDATAIAAIARQLTTPGMVVSGTGNTVTLSGPVADEETKRTVAANVTQTLGSAISVVNNLTTANGQPTAGVPIPTTPTTTPETPQTPSENAATECTTVNADVKNTLVQQKIQFELSGITVAESSRQTLKDIANKLKPCVDANATSPRVTVEGHASAEGNPDINQRLSRQRAESVRQVLIDHGLPAATLTAQGFGSSRPIADNGTPEGRNQNRRVEIILNSAN